MVVVAVERYLYYINMYILHVMVWSTRVLNKWWFLFWMMACNPYSLSKWYRKWWGWNSGNWPTGELFTAAEKAVKRLVPTMFHPNPLFGKSKLFGKLPPWNLTYTQKQPRLKPEIHFPRPIILGVYHLPSCNTMQQHSVSLKVLTARVKTSTLNNDWKPLLAGPKKTMQHQYQHLTITISGQIMIFHQPRTFSETAGSVR